MDITRIIVMGAPGSGKGTQIKRLAEYFEISALGTGKLLRKEVQNGSALGLEVEGYLRRGEYVPDVIMIDLVEDWLLDHPRGWLLDGFPRTLAQAKMIDRMIGVDGPQIVINLAVSKEALLSRVSSRRECSECHAVFSADASDRHCPLCGGLLLERSDDDVETFSKRYSNFNKHTLEVFDYYSKLGRLIQINGEQDPSSVFSELLRKLEEAQIHGQTKEE